LRNRLIQVPDLDDLTEPAFGKKESLCLARIVSVA
jgi:hypothetical protein